MTEPREDWKRLASYVTSARLAAGYRDVRAFAAATGVTERTLGKLERGEHVSPSTLAVVAQHVGWTPDSPRVILGGGEPEASRGAPVPSRNGMLPVIANAAGAPGVDRFRQQIRDELAEATQRFGAGFTGRQAFSDDIEAGVWDSPRFTPAEKETLIAEMRTFAARDVGGGEQRSRTTGLVRLYIAAKSNT